jgi:hypothetical protein
LVHGLGIPDATSLKKCAKHFGRYLGEPFENECHEDGGYRSKPIALGKDDEADKGSSSYNAYGGSEAIGPLPSGWFILILTPCVMTIPV